jgi:hypothetical protein
MKTFTASESLSGFLEALRPDLLVFPFARQEFDARGVDANLFGVFRSGLRDINGPEVLSSCCLQLSATNGAA